MSNSEGYRSALGASHARNADLERELDELRKLKAPDVAARKNHIMAFSVLWVVVLCVFAGAVWTAWSEVTEAREQGKEEVVRMAARVDALRTEYAVVQENHRRLVRAVEEQKELLVELRNMPRRQGANTSSELPSQSTMPRSRLSSEDLAQRLAQCSASRRGDFAYEEGVVVSHSVAFEGSSFYVNPCSFERTTIIRFPSGRELPLVQRSMARGEMMPGVACMVGASLDTIERIQAVWEPVVVGSIVGVTTRDDQIAGIRFTSK